MNLLELSGVNMMKWKWNKMNERIRELADEAAKFSAVMALPTGEPGDKLFVEKFAELIVEECVNLMENQREHYYSKILGQQSAEHYDRIISKGDAFDEAANIIKKHFRS